MVSMRMATSWIGSAATWLSRLVAIAAVAALGRPSVVVAAQADLHQDTLAPTSVLDGSQLSYVEVGDTLSEDDDNAPIPA